MDRSLPLALLLVAGTLLAPATGLAQSSDAVAILPTAGTDRAVVYRLTGSGDKLSAERDGSRTLLEEELAPASFTDFKVLESGANLLADGVDRGVLTTDDTGAVDFQLAGEGERPGIASASVAGYDAEDRADRLLFADEEQRTVEMYDQQFEEVVWANTIEEPAGSIEMVSVVALPGGRVAVGINWPSLQVTGIDVYDLTAEEPTTPQIRFANREHPGAPDALVTDSELSDLRDLFGLGDKRLLAVTSEALFVVSLSDETVERRLTLNDHADFAGAFQSARKLPSGRIAVATVQPGVWTSSHPNHRVYWLDSDLSTVEARTPALNAGPWRVEPAEGHGGSGTAGFAPDLSFLPTSAADDLELSGAPTVTPNPTQLQTATTTSADLRNPTGRPLFLASAAIRANPDGCEASNGWRTLVERVRVALPADSDRTVSGSFQLPDDVPLGSWCARVRIEDREANRRWLDPTVSFEVRSTGGDASGGTGRRVEPVDLGLRYAGDAGPSGGDSPRIERADGRGGCGCGSSRGTAPLPGGAVVLAWLLAAGLIRPDRS